MAEAPAQEVPEKTIDALLEPIPGDNATGENLRYEGTYDAIQEARREDDPTLPQGVWKTDLKQADWTEVATTCEGALKNKSKDLQVAAWLTEAWIRQRHVGGAALGLELMLGLCRLYWDDLFPQVEDGDLEPRIATFEWLNRRAALALRLMPVTELPGGEASATWHEWETSLKRAEEPIPAADEAEGEESARSRILGQIEATQTGFYSGLSEQITEAQKSLQDLDREITDRLGDQTPGLGDLRGVFDGAARLCERVLKEREAAAEQTTDLGFGDVEDDLEDEMSGEETSPPTGPITSRREAYRHLAVAADYLMKREPHSPAPYLVRRAIKWGRLSLAELLRELLRDNADLPTVYRLLGIQQSDSLEDEI